MPTKGRKRMDTSRELQRILDESSDRENPGPDAIREILDSVRTIAVVGISRNDTENHVLTFSNPGGHPPGAFGVKKYVVWNVREGLMQPGKWYLDRTAGKIVYWPLPDEDMTAVKSIAPTVESIVRLHQREEDRDA